MTLQDFTQETMAVLIASSPHVVQTFEHLIFVVAIKCGAAVGFIWQHSVVVTVTWLRSLEK